VSTPVRRTRGGDDGFTMLEALISLGIIGTVMASLMLFFVQSSATTAYQADSQAATQVAAAAMERVSLLPGDALLAGRTKAEVLGQWRAPGVEPYLATSRTELTWQDPTANPVTSAQSLPTTARTALIGGLASKFRESFYVGVCSQPPGAGDCTAVPATQQGRIPMYRVVVAVTWTAKQCPASACSYVTAMLVEQDLTDPMFGL
jgi:type II secretory pathway pseudopilin PulG